MLRDFEIRRWMTSQGESTQSRLVDVSVNDLADRRVWFAPEVGIVKQYATESRDLYARELLMLTSAIPGFARPRLLASEDLGRRGSLILMELASGQPLDQVYLDLAVGEYEQLADALGRALGSLHSASVSPEGGSEAWPSPLSEARRRDGLGFEECVSDLAARKLLGRDEAAGLKAGMAQFRPIHERDAVGAERARGWIHGDVHNENVFYERVGSEVSLTFIDFEGAAIAPVVLDLIHPFLNILGEALPGREFGDDRGPGHPIFAAFFSAYAEAGPEPIALAEVAPYAVAWYLGIASDATKAGIPAAQFYLQTALAAAQLLDWVPARLSPEK